MSQTVLSQAEAQSPPIRKIDDQEIKIGDQIGGGAYGSVHEGRWFYKPVAVKVLHITSNLKAEVVPDLEKEAALIGSLVHPNIITFYGLLKSNKGFVMEKMDGSLYDFIAEKKISAWPLPNRVTVLLDAASGLTYLHDQNVLHRDIKSMNILLGFQGAKLADFGNSKTKHHTSMTMTGGIGTPSWMAPEILMGESQYGKPADIYSLGLVLWEIIHEKVPFGDLSPPQIIAQVAFKQKQETIDEEKTPLPLKGLMIRCWKPAEERPVSREFLDALAGFLETLPDQVSETPPNVDEPFVAAPSAPPLTVGPQTPSAPPMTNLPLYPSLPKATDSGGSKTPIPGSKRAKLDPNNAEEIKKAFNAASSGNVEELHRLIEANLDVAGVLPIGYSSAGKTLLEKAVFLGNISMLKVLRETGVDFPEFFTSGECLGYVAVSSHPNMEAIRFLKDCGVDFTKANRTGGTNSARNPVFEMIRKGRVDLLEIFKADIDFSKTIDGKTLAFLAVDSNQAQMLQHFHRMGIELNAPNSDGSTPAVAAVRKGHTECLKVLKEAGVDFAKPVQLKIQSSYEPEIQEKTLFELAIAGSVTLSVRFLLEEGIKPPQYLEKFFNGQLQKETVAIYPAERGSVDILELLHNAGVDLSLHNVSGNNQGRTPAIAAIEKGQIEVLRTLHRCGVDLSKPIRMGYNQGLTLAHFAIERRQSECLRVLAELGCVSGKQVSTGRNCGETPIMVAVRAKNLEALKVLDEAGIDLENDFGEVGGSLAYAAAQFGDIGILKFLVKKNIDLLAPIPTGPSAGMTPIFVGYRILEVFQFLRDYGANLLEPVQSGSLRGWTLTYCCAQYGKLEQLKILKDAGANLKQPILVGMYEGITPAYVAAQYGQVATLEYLKSEGVDLSFPVLKGENMGETPATVAARHKRLDTLKFLHSSGVNLSTPIAAGKNKGQTVRSIATQLKDDATLQFLNENEIGA